MPQGAKLAGGAGAGASASYSSSSSSLAAPPPLSATAAFAGALLGRVYQVTHSQAVVNLVRRVVGARPMARGELLVLLEAFFALFRRIIPSDPASFVTRCVRVGRANVLESSHLCTAAQLESPLGTASLGAVQGAAV